MAHQCWRRSNLDGGAVWRSTGVYCAMPSTIVIECPLWAAPVSRAFDSRQLCGRLLAVVALVSPPNLIV